MKTKINENSILKTVAIIAASVLLFAGIPLTKYAKSIKRNLAKPINSISASQMSVQYLGPDANAFDFSVKFENNTAQKFRLNIKDDNGRVVYSKKFNDVHFFKTLQIEKDELGAYCIHPVFEIKTGNNFVQSSFSIQRQADNNAIVKKL